MLKWLSAYKMYTALTDFFQAIALFFTGKLLETKDRMEKEDEELREKQAINKAIDGLSDDDVRDRLRDYLPHNQD